MQPRTHSSSGISRPKKRDPKNVADPPVPPCKSEMLHKGVYNYLSTPRYLVPYTTPSSTDVTSDPCSGPSTSCKRVATAPISPWDCYKHARCEQDKEEEEKDEEDKENDEDKDEEDEEDDDPTKSEFSEFLI